MDPFLEALARDGSNAQLIQLALSACAATAAAQKAAAEAQLAAADASAANVRLVQAVVASRSTPGSEAPSRSGSPAQSRDDRPPPPPSEVSLADTGSTTSSQRTKLSVQAQTEVLLSWMQTLASMQPPTEPRVQLRFLLYPRNTSAAAKVLAAMGDAPRCKKLMAFARRLHALVNEIKDYPKLVLENLNLYAAAGHNVGGARVSAQKTPHFVVQAQEREAVRVQWNAFQQAVAEVMSRYKAASGRERKRMFPRWES